MGGRNLIAELQGGTPSPSAGRNLIAEMEGKTAPEAQSSAGFPLDTRTNPVTRGGARALKNVGTGIIDIAADYFPEETASAFGTTPDKLKSAIEAQAQGIRTENQAVSNDPGGSAWLESIGGVLGGAASLPLPSVGGSLLLNGALGGGATAALEPTVGEESRIDNAGKGAAAGAVASKVMGTFLNPVANKLSKEEAANASKLMSEGVNLTPAQRTGSAALGKMEAGFNDLPFTAGKQRDITEGQMQQFTQAVLKRAGINAEKATPDVLEAASKEIGDTFKRLSQANGVKIDAPLLRDIGAVRKDVVRRLGKDDSKTVLSYLDDIMLQRKTGKPIAGDVYQNTRSKLTKLAKAKTNTDPLIAGAYRDVRNALDAAAERSLPANAKGAWADVRDRYAVYKTIDKAMTTTGDNAVSGYISPTSLLNAVKVGNTGYARGYGQLNDIARAGKDIVASKVPDSGTAGRQMVQNLLTGGAFLGAGAAAGGIPAAVGALALPKAIQLGYNTKPVQNYLVNGITKNNGIPAIAARAAGSGATDNNPQQPPAVTLGNEPINNQGYYEEIAPQSNTFEYDAASLGNDFTQQEEGFRDRTYADTKGNPTIGYGFNFNSGIAQNVWKQAGIQTSYKQAKYGKAAITPDEAIALYRTSKKIAEDDARAYYPDFDRLNPRQQTALTDMSYQMGLPTLQGFSGLKKAIKTGNVNAIISSIRKSDIAPERGERIIQLLIAEK
jgi:GH24 family phage-related lysozyme (muramidase)